MMAFTKTEKEARHRAIHQMMEKDHLQALLLIGDTNVGHHFYGDLRYYTDNPVIFYRQIVLIFPQDKPVLLTGSEIQRQGAVGKFVTL